MPNVDRFLIEFIVVSNSLDVPILHGLRGIKFNLVRVWDDAQNILLELIGRLNTPRMVVICFTLLRIILFGFGIQFPTKQRFTLILQSHHLLHLHPLNV